MRNIIDVRVLTKHSSSKSLNGITLTKDNHSTDRERLNNMHRENSTKQTMYKKNSRSMQGDVVRMSVVTREIKVCFLFS
jgi:hypothetical protein